MDRFGLCWSQGTRAPAAGQWPLRCLNELLRRRPDGITLSVREVFLLKSVKGGPDGSLIPALVVANRWPEVVRICSGRVEDLAALPSSIQRADTLTFTLRMYLEKKRMPPPSLTT
jgi:hypothetical protein